MNVNRLRDALFDKCVSFGIPYADNQKLFNNMAQFEFESICVEDELLKDTETTTFIGKHIPISASIASNSIQEPIFLCYPNPCVLVSSFVDAVVNLATQSKAQMQTKFFHIEAA